MKKFNVTYRIPSKNDRRNKLVEASSVEDANEKATAILSKKHGDDFEIVLINQSGN